MRKAILNEFIFFDVGHIEFCSQVVNYFWPMPSQNRSRGKVANDNKLFAEKKQVENILDAVMDLSYLMQRGFAEKSAIQLVGNRYRLNVRQQKAVQGICASDDQVQLRLSKELSNLKGKTLAIDGFNLIIILESALSQAFIFKGMDGCYRDLSGVHGTYKRIQFTEQILVLVGEKLKQLGVVEAIWLLDKPISNSGRLKQLILEIANQNNFNWQVELVYSPDKELAVTEHVVVSSDAWILDQCTCWFNLAPKVLENYKIELFGFTQQE